jgi:undecaprenyl-diphosphatase
MVSTPSERKRTTHLPLVLDLIAAFVLGGLALVAALAYPGVTDPTASALDRADRAQPKRTPSWIRRVLASRLDRSVASGLLLTLALGIVIAGGVVLGVLAYLIRSLSATQGVDNAVAAWGFHHRSPLSTHGLRLITDLGTFHVVVVLAVVILVFDYVRSKGRWCAPFLLAVLAGVEILTWSVKDLAGRVRPAFDPAAAGLGPSFPSGHSATSAAFYAAAALVLGRFARRPVRVALIALAVAVAVAVAASRVLLDLHWLSDVVGGLALGWAWFALCAVMFGGRLLRPTAGIELAAAVAAGDDALPSAESGADEDVLEELTGPPSGASVDVPRRSVLERQP